jgi:hypothetical protein
VDGASTLEHAIELASSTTSSRTPRRRPRSFATRGIPPRVVDAVVALTHRDEDYVEKVATNDLARQVKLADLRRQPGHEPRPTSVQERAFVACIAIGVQATNALGDIAPDQQLSRTFE